MKTIIITLPQYFAGEADRITELLRQDKADIIHIRKPGSDIASVERLIVQIPQGLHNRLVLHDHHILAAKYHLYGIHLNSRNPTPLAGWQGSISRSCHSLLEVSEYKTQCHYVSLSPIFDSISKQGYLSAFTPSALREAARQGIIDEKVYALGGVTFSNLPLVKDLGFGGAMILGDAWS